MSRFRFRGKSRRPHEERADRVPLRAIVPNLVTSLAACAGITSIAFASEGRFLDALWALLIACVCDGMDGRIARLLKASSKLGAELDSLADFVNFGVAPAMYMFFWLSGKTFGAEASAIADPRVVRVLLGCALFYAMCDCFRLARFNTMLEQPAIPYWKHFFTGVPAPGGCWMVLTPAILYQVLEVGNGILVKGEGAASIQAVLHHPVTGMFMLLFVGALMASRLPTISLKSIKISRPYLPLAMVILLLLISCMFINFWLTMGVLGALYILTVPLTGMIFLKVRAKYEWDLTSAANKV